MKQLFNLSVIAVLLLVSPSPAQLIKFNKGDKETGAAAGPVNPNGPFQVGPWYNYWPLEAHFQVPAVPQYPYWGGPQTLPVVPPAPYNVHSNPAMMQQGIFPFGSQAPLMPNGANAQMPAMAGQMPGMNPYGMNPYGMNQMGMPQYGMPQYGMPQYGMPQYGMPNYGMPQSGAPQYGMPQYGAQQYGMPQMGQPSFSAGTPSMLPYSGMPNYTPGAQFPVATQGPSVMPSYPTSTPGR